MSIEDSYNFRRLSKNITTSGVVSENKLRNLSKEEYEVVINLLPTNHDEAVANEKEILELQGINYINIPVDFSAPEEIELEQFIEILDGIQDKKIHIHCAANKRVSVFYSIYAVEKGFWIKEQAYKYIESLWNPIEFPVWQELLECHGLG